MSVEAWRLGVVTEMEYIDEVPPCCDVCGRTDDEVHSDGEFWCGSCGSCAGHCEGYVDCPRWDESEVYELPGAGF